ncbi:MAG: hypothetical protein IJW29_00080 [Clostridia bacterium]|nr:hypothetical protein [Clostridia bacterium]
MDYIRIEEQAAEWGISVRRVQTLCASGKIEGAVRFGRDWMIPKGARRPIDGRTRAGRAEATDAIEIDMPLPRKTPFLYMSDLYNVPGCAAESAAKLTYNHEAHVLFEAELAYSRGEIDRVYESASYLLNKHSGFYAVLSAGMLLALCAMWRGDIGMWNKAKRHICEAPAKNDDDRDIMSLSITAVDSMLYDTTSFPEWFKIGNFEPLHPDALPAAKVFYAKYLYAAGYALATRQIEINGMQGLSFMSMLPHAIEPMISQAMADRSVIAEIYLRLTCATAYHNSGKEAQAIRHIDRAISLALPDGLYGILTEYRRTLGQLMDDRLILADRNAMARVEALYKTFGVGWATLSGTVRNRTVVTNLTMREREVAKLAAFGMSTTEIAEKLHLSVASIKQTARNVIYKSGVENKAALASIL